MWVGERRGLSIQDSISSHYKCYVTFSIGYVGVGELFDITYMA